MRIPPVLALLALAAFAACRSNTASTAPTACAWPAGASSPADSGPGGASAARYLLQCKDGSGFEICLSEDPNSCPGPNLVNGAISDCVDQCAESEYAIGAGGPAGFLPDGGGMASPPAFTPPANCRSLPGGPDGLAFWCCPCE